MAKTPKDKARRYPEKELQKYERTLSHFVSTRGAELKKVKTVPELIALLKKNAKIAGGETYINKVIANIQKKPKFEYALQYVYDAALRGMRLGLKDHVNIDKKMKNKVERYVNYLNEN